MTDVTPEDSVVPVILDPTPLEPLAAPPIDEAQVARRAQAIENLVALGLSMEDAQALFGTPGN